MKGEFEFEIRGEYVRIWHQCVKGAQLAICLHLPRNPLNWPTEGEICCSECKKIIGLSDIHMEQAIEQMNELANKVKL